MNPPSFYVSVPRDAPIGGLTYISLEIYDGDMTKSSVVDAVFRLIQERGAVTQAGLVKRINWPEGVDPLVKKKRVHDAILQLLLEEAITWTGGLPKQGVFFKEMGRKGFGLPLIRQSGVAVERQSLATKRKDEILLYLMESHTTQEVADEFGVTYLTAQRAMKTLEANGDVEGTRWLSGKSGRPPILWLVK